MREHDNSVPEHALGGGGLRDDEGESDLGGMPRCNSDPPGLGTWSLRCGRARAYGVGSGRQLDREGTRVAHADRDSALARAGEPYCARHRPLTRLLSTRADRASLDLELPGDCAAGRGMPDGGGMRDGGGTRDGGRAGGQQHDGSNAGYCLQSALSFSSRLDFRLDAPAPALVPQGAEGQIASLWRPRVAARLDPPAVAEA